MVATWRTYRGAPPVMQAFVAARFTIAPLRCLEAQVEGRRGRVLSIGSGLAMVERYLATGNPDLVFECTDLDEEKVAVIAATADRAPQVTLEVADALELDRPGRYEVALACDVLHHLPAALQDDALARLADSVAPGGVVVIKDLDATPRWKWRWNAVHDRLVAGPDPITCRPARAVAEVLEAEGLVIEECRRIDRRWEPYAHWIVRARRPS